MTLMALPRQSFSKCGSQSEIAGTYVTSINTANITA